MISVKHSFPTIKH